MTNSIRDIPDGTSNTIAVGEANAYTALGDFPTWAGTSRQGGAWGRDGTVMRRARHPMNSPARNVFSSPHTGGRHFTL